MIKLVVSDIDGTLLPEGTIELNPEFFEAVRELKKVLEDNKAKGMA